MANYDFAKILKAGTQAGYNALETKDSNVLYFCTDTGKLYKGTVDFTNNMLVAAEKPAAPIAGKIYFLADTNTVEAYIGGAWKVLSYPTTTTVDMDSDDMHVATAKAVYDAIQAAVEDVVGAAYTVKGVAAGTEAGQVVVTKGDDSTSTFTVPGVVTKPTWDATARVLTIPVTGGETVEVNIGKDIFLDSTAENKYNPETGKIELYLNDGKEGSTPTKIEIPAADFIDVYTGTTSNGTSVTVGSDNTIKVDLVLDPDANNALTLTAAGLKLDLSAYAKTEDVTAAIKVVQDKADANALAHQANTAAINKLNGSVTDEGSVAKQIADAAATIKSEYEAADNKVRGEFAAADDVVRGEFAAADNVVRGEFAAADTELSNRITALAAATTEWGTF